MKRPMPRLPEFPAELSQQVGEAIADAKRRCQESDIHGWQTRAEGGIVVQRPGIDPVRLAAVFRRQAIEIVRILAGACRTVCNSNEDYLRTFPAISRFAFFAVFPSRKARPAALLKKEVRDAIKTQLQTFRDALEFFSQTQGSTVEPEVSLPGPDAGLTPAEPLSVAEPGAASGGEPQELSDQSDNVPATYPNRAQKIKALVALLKPKIKANANALYAVSVSRHGGYGEPDRRTWTKLLRGDYVRDDSIDHAIAFFNRKGLKLKRTDIPDD